MNVCVITDDKMIQIDGEALNFDFTIDANIHAIEWNGSTGNVQFKDGTANEELTAITAYQSLIDAHATETARIFAIKDAKLVGFAELRGERDRLLALTDYVLLSDYSGTDTAEWLTYRQALRDLPDGYEPVKNVTYPVKPGTL